MLATIVLTDAWWVLLGTLGLASVWGAAQAWTRARFGQAILAGLRLVLVGLAALETVLAGPTPLVAWLGPLGWAGLLTLGLERLLARRAPAARQPVATTRRRSTWDW